MQKRVTTERKKCPYCGEYRDEVEFPCCGEAADAAYWDRLDADYETMQEEAEDRW